MTISKGIFLINCTSNLLLATSQPAHDVPATSLDGSLLVLTSGTYRRPSGDSQRANTKIDD